MTAEEQSKVLAAALESCKAADIKVYDARGKHALADFFVVATGAAAPHLKALVAAAQKEMKAAGVNSVRTSGDPESGYAKDPETGDLVDPETGNVVSGGSDAPAGLGSTNNQEVGIMDESPF